MEFNYLRIRGSVKITGNTIIFHAQKAKTDAKILSVVSTSAYFNSGEINADVKIANSTDKLLIVIGSNKNKSIKIGLNTMMSAYGIMEDSNGKKIVLAGEGNTTFPDSNEWLKIKIKYIGSVLELAVNGVIVSNININIHNSQVRLEHEGSGEAIIKNFKITNIAPKAFVIMQFTDVYKSLYEQVIKPVCEKHTYEVIRGDDMYTTGLIINDVSSAIKESALIIADITPKNLNVYYEVGYAHAINKPTILLKENGGEALPFDLSAFRHIAYDNTIAGKPMIEEKLDNHLQAIENA